MTDATRPIDARLKATTSDVAHERVQPNRRSRSYDLGRYSPTRENGVHHCHSLLHEFLS